VARGRKAKSAQAPYQLTLMQAMHQGDGRDALTLLTGFPAKVPI